MDTTEGMDNTELQKIIATIRAQEEAKFHEKLAEEEAKFHEKLGKLERGEFFTPWPSVWTIEKVLKSECNGAFDMVCRKQGYANNVPEYGEVLTLSMSESEKKTAYNEKNEKNDPDASKDWQKVKKKDRRNKVFSASSKSSKTSGQRKMSAAAALLNQNSVGSSLSGSSKAPAASQSKASAASQSLQFPDFGGRYPSTRAHMIPNIKTSECYKYYNVICQAVVGFRCTSRPRLEKIAKELAESRFNFLRAPINHGSYFDNKPCWILVPACPLPEILDWTPDKPYPVLAVPNTSGEVSRQLCRNWYNDKKFNPEYGAFKRSQCKKEEFDEATHNLRQMTLAMAETLVRKGLTVRPDGILDTIEVDKDDRDFISKKLKSKTAANEGDEKSGEEESGIRMHLKPAHYALVQFEETRRSLNNGIMLPQASPELDLDRFELLQFEVNPELVDLYPDPMLLLIKAAVNWSWWCNQKLLPAYGRLNEEEEEEELVVPSTPIPTVIKLKAMLVTPDEDISV